MKIVWWQINSSSRFAVENKYVRLVAKDWTCQLLFLSRSLWNFLRISCWLVLCVWKQRYCGREVQLVFILSSPRDFSFQKNFVNEYIIIVLHKYSNIIILLKNQRKIKTDFLVSMLSDGKYRICRSSRTYMFLIKRPNSPVKVSFLLEVSFSQINDCIEYISFASIEILFPKCTINQKRGWVTFIQNQFLQFPTITSFPPNFVSQK